jgi:hypothetical protein
MSLTYERASEPLHIYFKKLFLQQRNRWNRVVCFFKLFQEILEPKLFSNQDGAAVGSSWRAYTGTSLIRNRRPS